MRGSSFFLHNLTLRRCSLHRSVMGSKVMALKTCVSCNFSHNQSSHNSPCSYGTNTVNPKISQSHQKGKRLVKYHLEQCRQFCTKDSDIKNDSDTKSLLNEIISDFESAKTSQMHKNTPSEYPNEEKKNAEEKHEGDNLSENNSSSKYQPVEIELEEDFDQEHVAPPWVPPISLKRGSSGVFEVEELVALLEKENGRDITVIDVPPEAQFADHMVIVSAISIRHLRSMSSRVKWIHKRRKGEQDTVLKVDGFDTAPDWHAMDLGNIILHLFMPETRERYDLETLWTHWGQPGQVETEVDPYEISPEDDFWSRLEPQHDKDDKNKK